ncbi:MAG: GC-type dockerin domain-anchored protein [Phycisphaerales bacterium]
MQSPMIQGGSAFRAIGRAGNDIWACGSKHSELPPPAASSYPLAARLNGDHWEVVFVPPLAETGGRSYNHIRAIEGANEDDAWAGGVAQESGTGFGPAAMMIHWDGSQWSQYDLTQVVDSVQFSSVESIEVLTTDDAWAAGFDYDIARQVTIPLILHWDGNAWSNIPVPIFEHSAELRAITARSSDDIYASGTKTFGDGYPHSLILHWDGIAWTEVPESTLVDYGTWFRGMASVDGELWAAGQSNDLSSGITQRQQECSSDCMADMNKDGVLDFFDISSFLSAFAAHDISADITSNGSWDFFDVSAFLDAFASDCP